MEIFRVHQELVDDYRSFTTSAVAPLDPRIHQYVQDELAEGKQWPDPWLWLNPMFASGGSIHELVTDELLHPECSKIFRPKRDLDDVGTHPITPHRHQCEAVEAARSGRWPPCKTPNTCCCAVSTAPAANDAYWPPATTCAISSLTPDRPPGSCSGHRVITTAAITSVPRSPTQAPALRPTTTIPPNHASMPRADPSHFPLTDSRSWQSEVLPTSKPCGMAQTRCAPCSGIAHPQSSYPMNRARTVVAILSRSTCRVA